MLIAVSPLVFSADFITQEALTVVEESLLRFFYFKSVKTENILSGSVIELGSARTALKTFIKVGYL